LLAGANLVYAQSGGASITLQPVPPKTVPPSNYPPGTTIVGQEIILDSVPARVWLEVHVTGWPSVPGLRYISVRPDQAIRFGIGGECEGVPSNGGEIRLASVPCTSRADCRNQLAGYLSCPGGNTPYCAGGLCTSAFMDMCHPSWLGDNICYPEDWCDAISYFGGLVSFFEYTTDFPLPDFEPSYLGTMVVDVPAEAKGTYTIGFVEAATFMKDWSQPPQNIPIEALNPAIIIAPCGRCCFGYDSGNTQCFDHTSMGECADGSNEIFSPDVLCPQNGSPACAECATDGNCNDGVACTFDQCEDDHSCSNMPSNAICGDGLFCNGPEICDPASGCIAGPVPCDPNLCDEFADECRAGIPTVSIWGLVTLGFLLLIAAKLRYRRLAATTLPS
jgi:hypothetical protein